MSKHHPTSKPELHRPLAPSDAFGASSLPEGAMGFCHFTSVCTLGSAYCESLRQKSEIFASSL